MDKKTINTLIGKFDKKQLQELITHIVSVNESAQEALLDYCMKKDTDVKTDNHTLIIENKVRRYWKKAAQVIEEFDMYGGGPEADEDDAYAALGDMTKLMEDNEVSWSVRKEILDQMLDFVESDNSGFTDYLMDIALIMCKSKQENLYLADFLTENREDLSEEDFNKEESQIMNVIKKHNLSSYFDILIDKCETKEVIEYITQHQQYRGWGLDEGHYFSKRLSGEYPREVVDMYWKEAALYVSRGKENNYRHAVSVLKEIRTIMKRNKWTEEWNARYRAFLEEHRRKKLLLKALEGFQA